MPKSIVVDPREVRAAQTLKIKSIPINQYKPDIAKERKKLGVERLERIYYDMLVIREFETMLDSIKKQGVYEGIEYEHKGPAHLSIGQESAAVGECVHLDVDDLILGSHRSHGEILAKCLSAVTKRNDEELLYKTIIIKGVMSIQSGDNPRIVEQKLKTFLPPGQRGSDGDEEAEA